MHADSSLDECTFFPLTNSVRETKKEKEEKKKHDQMELFNIVMTKDEAAIRAYKMEKFYE